MTLWKYRYFVDVVDMKSFTRAGKKNFVSQTAVSQQIADLEKKVGGKLLYKEAGAIQVTELGQIVYKRAKEILALEDRLKNEIEQYQNDYVVKIGIDSSINRILWGRMQDMIDQYFTEADFQFNKLDLAIGSRMLRDHIIDIYIGYAIEPDCGEDLGIFELCQSETGIYVGEQSTLDVTRPISLESLQGYVRYGTDEYPCSMISDKSPAFQSGCRDVCRIGNTETMKLKVEFNDGYAFVDRRYFSQSYGKVCPVCDLDHPQILSVYYHKGERRAKLKDVLSKLKIIV